MMRASIADIIVKLDSATIPNRELDAEINAALFGGRASHTFSGDTRAGALRCSYGAGVVFDHEDPETNGGHVLNGMVRNAPRYTESIDEAIRLVGAALPGSTWMLRSPRWSYGFEASVKSSHNRGAPSHNDRTGPLAILSAMLRVVQMEAQP